MKSNNKTLSAREAALKILGQYRRNKAWSDLALNSVVGSSNLSQVDISLTVQLVYGVLQNMALCDFYARNYSNMELKKLEPRVLDILRLSIYQIVLLTKIPSGAAVNEGVALTKKYSNGRAAGYVNALLRKISKAAQDGQLPEVTGTPSYVLSVKYSHPQWLVEKLTELLGQNGTEAFLSENNSGKVPITAQVNTLLASTGEVLEQLGKAGVEAAPHNWLENCIEFRGAGNIMRLDCFDKGHLYVQDVAARLAVIAANPSEGNFLIDGCAAPGGKSFTSAIMMGNQGLILACDVHPAKIRHIESGSSRLGINIIKTLVMDASKESKLSDAAKGLPYDFADGRLADVVLADVPCSGFGIVRKKPEIRYKTPQEISGLPEIQKSILSALSAHVRPGGVLLYSTCTILPAENEDVLESFLSSHPHFSLEAFALPEIGEVPGGMITLWPHIHGTDGFFIAKLRKAKLEKNG
ncbi:MAG: 16S rRNA (cytosine(967)-C(5))-methyltransferase RsmB [Oscillospiraceae bacterium]|nr:16S rRNA (cytosine(967)-C(5))-methyltransferase RsmB [Oscillospiraceae bacterium]